MTKPEPIASRINPAKRRNATLLCLGCWELVYAADWDFPFVEGIQITPNVFHLVPPLIHVHPANQIPRLKCVCCGHDEFEIGNDDDFKN